MTSLHCTACDATVQPGATKCPGCGLQLTASVAPAVYVERGRWPFWPVVLGAFFLVILLGSQLDRQDAAKASSNAESFAADVDAGRLSNADLFERRCGVTATHVGTGLRYPGYVVSFSAGSALIQAEQVEIRNERAHAYRMNADAAEFFKRVGCK